MVHQCTLLDIGCSDVYYQRVGVSVEKLALMKLINDQYLAMSFYGKRRMAAWLRNEGHKVNRKRVRRPIGIMALKAIYKRARTSTPAKSHRVYFPTC